MGSQLEAGIAFAFPGQGSYDVEMGKFLNDPAYSSIVEPLIASADTILSTEFGIPIPFSETMTDGTALADQQIGPCAIYLTGYAAAKILTDIHGITPDVVVGHSFGEITALAYAEVFTFEDGLRLAAKRGQITKDVSAEHPGGLIAALGIEEGQAQTVAQAVNTSDHRAGIESANINAPDQVVFAFLETGRGPLKQALKDQRIRHVELKLTFPAHSSHMQAGVEPLTIATYESDPHSPKIPCYSPTAQTWMENGDQIAHTIGKGLVTQVRFADAIRTIVDKGVQTIYEVNASRPVLEGLIKQTVPHEVIVYQSSDIAVR